MPTSSLIQLMKEKAEAVQAVVVKIKTMKEAFQYTVWKRRVKQQILRF
jgi:hypothetical protein